MIKKYPRTELEVFRERKETYIECGLSPGWKLRVLIKVAVG
jgi:hypothetical protein